MMLYSRKFLQKMEYNGMSRGYKRKCGKYICESLELEELPLLKDI